MKAGMCGLALLISIAVGTTIFAAGANDEQQPHSSPTAAAQVAASSVATSTDKFPEYPVIEAHKHVGQEVTVIGRLDCIECMRRCFLYFGSCNQDAVLSVFLPENPEGPQLDVSKLKGVNIAVTGKIEGSAEQPRISLKSTSQIAPVKEPTLSELESAIAREDKRLRADPRNADAFYQRGLAREKLAALHHLPDEYRAAIADYDKATTLDASNSNGFVHIGDCYAALQDYVAAKRAWDKAIEASPEAKQLLKDSIEKERRRYVYAAISDLDTLTVIEPKNAALYYRKAKLYLMDHSNQNANDNYKLAAQFEPTNLLYSAKAAHPLPPSRQMTVEQLKDALITGGVTVLGAAFGAAALRDIDQEQRVKQIIAASGGRKIRCPNCRGSGVAYEETYNSASNPYRMGTWDYMGFENQRKGQDLRTCARCRGDGVVDK